MAKFRVTSPDGQSWEVNAPDGASPDQALAFAKQQWSAQLTQAKQPQKQAPIEDPGIAKTLGISAGRTFDRVLDGMTQMYLGAHGEDSALGGLKQNVQSKTDAYQPLKDMHPIATGIGESAPSMVIPAGGAATLWGNAGRMALAGGIPGALEYGTVGERATRAGVGAAAGASIPLLGAGFKTVKSFFEPLYQAGRETIAGRLLNTVAGESADAIKSRLASAAPVVSGSMPTVAQVAESGGLSALQRAAGQANPEAYTRRAMEQASARLNALRGIAGDDVAMEAAKTARDSASGNLYKSAFDKSAKSTPDLVAALDRLPSGVLEQAKALAKMSGHPLKEGADIPSQMVETGVLDAFGKPIMQATKAQESSYSGKALHYIKLALDDAIGKTGDGAMGNTAKRLAVNTKEDLLKAIDTQIPDYGAARTTFANLSRPVNQMQVGQELLGKLEGPLADYGGLANETGSIYARALRNAEQTVKAATGMKNATLPKVMTPNQMQTLEGIAQDLARKANEQNLGRGVGSDTFQKLAMNNIAQQSGVPRLMGGLLETPGISRATRWIYSDADQKMQGLLADTLLNPQEAAQLMTKASKQALLPNSPKAKKALEQLVLRGGLLAVPAHSSSAEQ